MMASTRCRRQAIHATPHVLSGAYTLAGIVGWFLSDGYELLKLARAECYTSSGGQSGEAHGLADSVFRWVSRQEDRQERAINWRLEI